MDNLNDLISRVALLKDLSYCAPELWQDEEYIKAKIMKQHAVDAAPVVHGRWMNIPDKPEWDQKMCSVCGDYFCCQVNYCPNCGAKMDGERRDDDAAD